jgi:hypothetical protein
MDTVGAGGTAAPRTGDDDRLTSLGYDAGRV